MYTNFYILHKYANKDGRMIDRTKPEESLLLQYGLPREMTNTPHPDVPGWRPRFTSKSDRLYEQYRAFIDSLWQPTPDYGITYTPPGQAGRTDQQNQQPSQNSQPPEDGSSNSPYDIGDLGGLLPMGGQHDQTQHDQTQHDQDHQNNGAATQPDAQGGGGGH